jgi:hypothetical protein
MRSLLKGEEEEIVVFLVVDGKRGLFWWEHDGRKGED